MGLFQRIVSGTFSHETETHDPLKDLDDRGYLLRKNFERLIRGVVQVEFPEEAPKIAESVTGYVFDFGDFDFDQSTKLAFKKTCESTLRKAYLTIDIPAEEITAAMVHRGWRQGRPSAQLIGHLVNLFDLGLAIVGQRARAAGPMLFTVHKDQFLAIVEAEPPVERIAKYLTLRSEGKTEREKVSGAAPTKTDAAATGATEPAGNAP